MLLCSVLVFVCVRPFGLCRFRDSDCLPVTIVATEQNVVDVLHGPESVQIVVPIQERVYYCGNGHAHGLTIAQFGVIQVDRKIGLAVAAKDDVELAIL